MNSIIRRILAKDDVQPITDYPAGRAVRESDEEEPLPAELALFLQPDLQATSAPTKAALPYESHEAPAPKKTVTGRRFALCIGINRYNTSPLNGCVADAESWARTLVRRGFEQPVMMLDEDATRDNILGELRAIVQKARARDVVVLQYAGHGTQLPDADGEEVDEQDEALCPIDYEDGNFVIDDDLSEVFSGLAQGVNLTCFFDCCHSGTITRLAGRAGHAGKGSRPRFVKATEAQVKKHLAKRKKLGARALRRAAEDLMREVSFTACRADQVAYESDGHGDFTRIATGLLDDLSPDTHTTFLERVVKAFGSTARQQPQLDCDLATREFELLQAFSVEA